MVVNVSFCTPGHLRYISNMIIHFLQLADLVNGEGSTAEPVGTDNTTSATDTGSQVATSNVVFLYSFSCTVWCFDAIFCLDFERVQIPHYVKFKTIHILVILEPCTSLVAETRVVRMSEFWCIKSFLPNGTSNLYELALNQLYGMDVFNIGCVLFSLRISHLVYLEGIIYDP